ncbi:MAG: TetR/AcrR family transcriptional regulator [Pseudomonadales bacterium]|nr:TetR/AcrR family transcriptional regulator [Pseudomonadales bacterium]
MARTAEFDQELVLEKAMNAFWHRGVENTSINTLVEATGLKRSSLYNTFGSKEGLFRESFTLYIRNIMNVNFAPLKQDDANIATIIAHFRNLKPVFETPEPHHGCLLVNTAASSVDDAKNVDDIVSKAFADMQGYFHAALSRSKARGEIASTVQVEEQAKLLVAHVIAIANLARTTGGKVTGKVFIADLLQRLEQL